jgi:ligand-binding sensor domain-containing protein/putative methionine-R-sulfoxide reductase with GAF domain
MDKNGILWVATADGLNTFNGKTVNKLFKQEYPQLQTDFLSQVHCDDKNRIWVMDQTGHVTLIDENRVFHRVSLWDHNKLIPSRRILYTKEFGMVLFTRKGFFCLSPDAHPNTLDSLSLTSFIKLNIEGFDSLQAKVYAQAESFDDNTYLLTNRDAILKIDFKSRKVDSLYPYPNAYILGEWLPGELLTYNKQNPELQSINLTTRAVSYPLRGVKDQFGELFQAEIINSAMLNKEELLLTSRGKGMFLFNIKTRKLTNYRHDAADPTTMVNNNPSVVTIADNGWVFLGLKPNGISYFKSDAVIGQASIFMDKQGNSYDGHINSIATQDNNTFYIATGNCLLKWNRNTNTTTFFDHATIKGKKIPYEEGVGHLAFDNLNRLWFTARVKGVVVMDSQDRTIKNFPTDSTQPDYALISYVNHIQRGPDDYMWIATTKGVFRVNTTTFSIDSLPGTKLSQLKNTFCYFLYFADKDNLWIGTRVKGLCHYTISTGKMEYYNTKDGFKSSYVFCINKDRLGNIYAGTDKGLHILLANGKIKWISQKDGLMNNRIEALLLDKKNRMWIGNDVGIACYNIADSSLRFFDESYGLSIQGFRVYSYCQNTDDELVWGTERGLQYFYPDKLYNYTTPLKVTINRIESRNIIANLTQSKTLDLAASDNYVTFYFSTIEYLAQLRTFYEYKLEGIDPEWIKVVNQDFVRYSSLPPGKYTFKVRAGSDGKIWKDADNTVTVSIAKSIWQRTWFRLLGGLLVLLLVIFVIRFYRRKQVQQREELETELVINYFASLINRHQKTEDILWDVAKNCISKLNFEDCVIYLIDPEKNILVQKAAYGPKMKRDYTIYQPIEIPLGKGIVGTVAQSGKAELVNNTEGDERYIVDDTRRYSEVAVPLIIDDKVIGVIDSEHSRKNFFTQKHLNILSTIAVLCANQIQRAKAEEEKQQAKIEVLENKQKVTESRLQSLRLQMNPHFLFNALNSIQQMILANEEMVATRYLSRFSKLLRTILVHSDTEMVTLKEELEILNLYIELEAVRFKDSFTYTIRCDDDIDVEEVKVPTLLVQPFVENAIWHGLMHKEGDRKLEVSFFEKDEYLQCVIQDNGIGREKAREMKMARGKDHTSKGIEVSVERLKTLRNGNGHAGSLEIIDLKDAAGAPMGTRIEIYFPIQN